MGFNISGIIIENNFGRNIQNVSENLEIGFGNIEECEPCVAKGRIYEKDNAFICFTDTSTIILYEPEQFDKNIYSQTSNSLNFQYFEGAMIFAIRYIKNCETVRNLMSIDGKIVYSTGRKLRAENDARGIDEVVLNLSKQISGISILELDEQTQVAKCRFVDYVGIRKRKSEKEIHAIITERRISRNFSDFGELL